VRHDLVIFDFDGTLADSLTWLLSVFDDVADRFGFRRLDRANLAALRGFDAWQILEHQQIARWKVPRVVHYVRMLMERDIARIRLFPGIDLALQRIAASGTPLALASSNSLHNVRYVLGVENTALFRHLECGASISGKAARLRRLLAASHARPAATLFVGDEIRDLRAAQQVGVRFGAVAWGYTRGDVLVAHGAHEHFATTAELGERLTTAPAPD
jgi:phosphoglycolate phosphatase